MLADHRPGQDPDDSLIVYSREDSQAMAFVGAGGEGPDSVCTAILHELGHQLTWVKGDARRRNTINRERLPWDAAREMARDLRLPFVEARRRKVFMSYRLWDDFQKEERTWIYLKSRFLKRRKGRSMDLVSHAVLLQASREGSRTCHHQHINWPRGKWGKKAVKNLAKRQTAQARRREGREEAKSSSRIEGRPADAVPTTKRP